MRITVLVHEDLNAEESAIVTKFVEAVARAGGSIVVQGDPELPPRPWEITPAGLRPGDVDPPAVSYDLGGSYSTRLSDAGASTARAAPFLSNKPSKE
jgi:hypothetical protein